MRSFRGYFNASAIEYEVALRRETINTTEAISAIRAVDISGQNGTALMNTYSTRSVEFIFRSNGIGQGFNFSVELYNNKSAGVAYKGVSMWWLVTLIVAGLGFGRNL